MLEPNQRRLLLEALRPPVGYQLDRAIGTTYGLDLEALLLAPLAFTFFQWEDADGDPTKEPLALLEALRRHAEKLSIFCQAGEIPVPQSRQPLHAALEDSVIQVRPPIPGALFHPKMWALRFVAGDGDASSTVRYRLLVMSRNLTLSNSWDLMLALDGTLMDRQLGFSLNHPLADFIAALPGMARDVPPRVARDVTLVERELRKVHFELPPDVDRIAFWGLGLQGRRVDPFQGRLDRCLVVSPFVSSEWLRAFLVKHPKTILISREEALHALEPDLLDLIGDCRYLGVPDPEPDDGEEDGPAPKPVELGGLHAKLFVADAGWTARAWVGSANATQGAFGINVEFMVELEGKASRLGIDALVNKDAESGGFGHLLRKYEASEGQGSPDPADEARRVGSEIRAQLAAVRLIATAEVAPDRVGYSLLLDLAAGDEPIDLNLKVLAWPSSLGSGHASRLVPGATGSLARFEGLSLLDVTAFFCFEAARLDRPDLEPVRFTLNLPIRGLPDDRQEQILRALLSDSERVARYILMLLALDSHDGSTSGLGFVQLGWGSQGSGWQLTETGLFEALLGVLRDDPGRLKHVAAVVKALKADHAGGDLLPSGFGTIWDAVWSAAEPASTQ
jgi:hypothetical protein